MDVSRSEQKRRIKQIEELADEMAGLPAAVIAGIPVNEEVRGLLRDAAGMKGGARKRQVKYITKLLKNEPLEEVYAFLSARKGFALQEKRELHELEFYRDSLINEVLALFEEAEEYGEEINEEQASPVAEEIAAKLPGIDPKDLTSLAWLYARTRNRKYSREIYRQMRSSLEQKKRFPAKD